MSFNLSRNVKLQEVTNEFFTGQVAVDEVQPGRQIVQLDIRVNWKSVIGEGTDGYTTRLPRFQRVEDALIAYG